RLLARRQLVQRARDLLLHRIPPRQPLLELVEARLHRLETRGAFLELGRDLPHLAGPLLGAGQGDGEALAQLLQLLRRGGGLGADGGRPLQVATGLLERLLALGEFGLERAGPLREVLDLLAAFTDRRDRTGGGLGAALAVVHRRGDGSDREA